MVTKKLPQELNRTESRILGLLSKLETFPPNPQVRAQFRTVRGTSRVSNTGNQEPNEDRSIGRPKS